MKRYTGWILTDASREKLRERFSHSYPNPKAHHITHELDEYGVPPAVKSAQVVGYSDDDKGIQCLIVKINGTIERPDMGIYHITWSLDAKAGYTSKMSNDIALLGYSLIQQPIDITVVPMWRDEHGIIYHKYTKTEVDLAKQRCLWAGSEPNFLGTKGYVNWEDYTVETKQTTKDFVEKTKLVFNEHYGKNLV
jgi:hypothetical protein